MRRPDDEGYQRAYFDVAAHQYPRAAVVMPPRHTEVEGQNLLNRLEIVKGDGPIIDFGAGTGRLSITLARAGHTVLAVDVSERSLAVLRGAARDLGLPAIETASVLPSCGQLRCDRRLGRVAPRRSGCSPAANLRPASAWRESGLLRAWRIQSGVVRVPIALPRASGRAASRHLQPLSTPSHVQTAWIPRRPDHRARAVAAPTLRLGLRCL